MKRLPAETDFVVVGAGIAGLRAAIELAHAGSVLVLAKKEYTESATQYAQGGIAAALSDEDEVGLHLQDTLDAGAGLCDEAAARVLVEEGPERIEELIAWGTEFDRKGSKLAFTREGAHSRNRILHAHGDSTGREIGRALYLKASALKQVEIHEFELATDVQLSADQVSGICLMDEAGHHRNVRARAVLLATGGLGQVYLETTNPGVATGDGVAMAYRAGAEISDMEFVQFHPTALYLKGAPRFLLSEALRGEGAYLRNEEMTRFMPKYHPLAELAPRDVVARAIAHELQVSKAKQPVVYLDLTHLDADHVRRRFPMIYQTCLKHNVDIGTDLVPVRPAAHYAMGGVRTDLEGRTTVRNLYAAGEVACTGVHGANRLASNSLLEGLVFGARAARAMANAVKAEHAPPVSGGSNGQQEPAEAMLAKIRELMWNQVGIVRTRAGLQNAISELQEMGQRLPGMETRRGCEAVNVHTVALLIARSAVARQESRGAHYRTDYPETDDGKFRKHSVVRGNDIRFV